MVPVLRKLFLKTSRIFFSESIFGHSTEIKLLPRRQKFLKHKRIAKKKVGNKTFTERVFNNLCASTAPKNIGIGYILWKILTISGGVRNSIKFNVLQIDNPVLLHQLNLFRIFLRV